ncbi:MAG: leucine-rich repeat domain-containing protein, partial [Bacteroidota bacterium]
MNKIKLFIALLIGLIASATTMAQTVNMSSYITLTVTKDAAIRLNLKAAVTNTPIRIVSGSNTQDITVGTAWTGKRVYNADGTNMTIYGDLTGFDCSVNVAKLTALDASKNTQLTVLSCSNNQLTALDVSNNTQLTMLYCSNNQLSSLDVSKNTQLERLSCGSNNLTSLDVSKNTQLTKLYCGSNKLTTLDVSKNT